MSLDRSTLSDQIYKQLREDIILGKIPSGKRITMRELQEQFSISSTPVREALTRLAQDRLVEYITNQGAKVIELTAQDVRELLEMCTLYDCYAVEKAMENPDRDELLEELRAAIQRQKNYQKNSEKSHKEYSAIFNDFHETIYAFSGNAWMKNATMEYNSFLFLADVRKRIDYPEIAIQEHQAILDAIASDDSALAVSRMKEHRANEWTRYLSTD